MRELGRTWSRNSNRSARRSRSQYRTPTTVVYADVAQIKGQNLTNGQKIAITAAVLAVIGIIVLVIILGVLHGG